MSEMPVKVIRSKRRRKTISARMKNGELILYLPARMSRSEEGYWVDRMTKRILNRKNCAPASDEALMKRAEGFNKRYFDGRLSIGSIAYSDRQRRRYGSCTTANGSIRIARRLGTMPPWVLDYVIVHELAHLVHPDHSREFWELVNRYPLSERARGFLIAKDLEEG